MMNKFLILIFLITTSLLLAQIQSVKAQSTLQLILTLDNTNNNVYIPGVGEKSSASLGSGTTYTSPLHYYLASYLNNNLYGLVFFSETPASITASSTQTTHSLKLSQNISNSKSLLIFTKGDWGNIENRIESVESQEFLLNIEPTFGYALGFVYPVKILLRYPSIDLSGNLILQKGIHKIFLENNGTVQRKLVIIITRG